MNKEFWIYKTEYSESEITKIYSTLEFAKEAAIIEWDSYGEEYDKDLTWFTKVKLVK